MVLEFDDGVGVSEWFSVLGWGKLPDMGPCHSLAASGEVEKFRRRYLITDDLQRFYVNILTRLKSHRVGQPVVLLKGEPGIGKTTLVYTLKAHLTDNEELNSNYFMYACHANYLDNDDWELDVLEHSRNALRDYFYACGQKKLFDKICGDDDGSQARDLKRQVNRLKTCVMGDKDRGKFKLTLIFVLDNVDTVSDGDRILDAFELINKILEPARFKKWFVVRPNTFSGYNKKKKARLESFVSHTLIMPKVSLFEVAEKRIMQTTGSKKNIKNPFDKALCDEIILTFCEGSIRKGLSVLESLLLNTEAKGFAGKSVSEKVIQNYLRKNIVRILYNEDLLINLHSMNFSAKALESPMAYDLLCFTRFSSDHGTLLSMLYDSTERRNRSTEYSITGRDNKFTIYDHEFGKLVSSLKESKLVNITDDGKVVITPLGLAHVTVSSPVYYAKVSSEQVFCIRTKLYWKAAAIDVSHSAIATRHSTSAIR